MNRSWLLALALALSLSGAAFAGGTGAPSAWLGNRVNVAQTAFCRANGCELVEVRQNNDAYQGWHDGTHRTYRLKGGERLEVAVRPGGGIRGAYLFFPDNSGAEDTAVMGPNGYRLAAEFLGVVTGRRLAAESIAACEARTLAEHALDPDVSGTLQPLSEWTTPTGFSYRARCGITWQLGVWAD